MNPTPKQPDSQDDSWLDELIEKRIKIASTETESDDEIVQIAWLADGINVWYQTKGDRGNSPADARRYIISSISRLLAHQQAAIDRAVAEASDAAFKEGQRVGQYQASDKLYHHTTTMWLFKDDLSNKNANIPQRISEMNKDCEKFLNHNWKVYVAYLRSDRYKRLTTLTPKESEKTDG